MLLDQIKGTKQFATFTLPDGEVVSGEFLLDGPQTYVILYTDGSRLGLGLNSATLHADLPMRGSISFVNCILQWEKGVSERERQSHQICLYPHFAVVGSRAVPSGACVSRLGIVVDDFADIYYDFDAFGFDFAPDEHIGHILESVRARVGRRVESGDEPVIAYFTGRTQLFRAGAPFGRVSARHRVIRGMGDPRGVPINNMVQTDLEFDPPTTFDEAITNLMPVLGFLEIIAGRRQKLLHIELALDLSE